MLTNHNIIDKKYKCNEHVMRYLVYKHGLTILSYDDKYYYFAITDTLKTCLLTMPLHLKLLSKV